MNQYYQPWYEDGQWSYKLVAGRKLDKDKFEEFKTRFYELEGWEKATGWPTRSTLEELDLVFVADELESNGKLGKGNNTIYGTISGVAQEGINVEVNVYSCGAPQSVVTLTTDASGYYSIGNLENGQYGIVPQKEGYSFTPKYLFLQIPQTEIQSYDFTATEIVSCGETP